MTVKKLLECKPEGGREKERLRLRLMDDVELGLSNMGMKDKELWTEQTGHM
jgi:hypothetical protein